MKRFALIAAGLLLAALNLAHAATTTTLQGTLLSDRWQYPFGGTPGTEARAALFMSGPASGPGTVFNRRDGEAILKFHVTLPPNFVGKTLTITSASLVCWCPKTEIWVPHTTNSLGRASMIEAFATGFGPTYNENAWAGTEAYVGSNSVTAAARDPYPRDFVYTTQRVEDNVTTATNWGEFLPVGYTPSAMTEAFPVYCQLKTNSAAAQQEFRSDLTGGISTWTVTSSFDAVQPPAPSSYPSLLMSEAVGVATYGTKQQAPLLRITLAALPNAAQQWAMYE